MQNPKAPEDLLLEGARDRQWQVREAALAHPRVKQMQAAVGKLEFWADPVLETNQAGQVRFSKGAGGNAVDPFETILCIDSAELIAKVNAVIEINHPVQSALTLNLLKDGVLLEVLVARESTGRYWKRCHGGYRHTSKNLKKLKNKPLSGDYTLQIVEHGFAPGTLLRWGLVVETCPAKT
jgi:hypothetical protein